MCRARSGVQPAVAMVLWETMSRLIEMRNLMPLRASDRRAT
jgi:hypothetical protein